MLFLLGVLFFENYLEYLLNTSKQKKKNYLKFDNKEVDFSLLKVNTRGGRRQNYSIANLGNFK